MDKQETHRLLAVLDQAISRTDAEDDVVMVARWFIEDFANHLHSLQAEIDRLKAEIATLTQQAEPVVEPEQPNLWRDAVEDELSTLQMVASDDPLESIRRLIDWHCAVQIDPLVSSAARELIERGKREALEASPEQAQPVTCPIGLDDASHLCSAGDCDVCKKQQTQPMVEPICRTDGRCQYAIDSGAEAEGRCPKGKCVMPEGDAITLFFK
jgi:hypothetical protein